MFWSTNELLKYASSQKFGKNSKCDLDWIKKNWKRIEKQMNRNKKKWKWIETKLKKNVQIEKGNRSPKRKGE